MEHQRAVQNLAVESYLLGEMSPSEREAFEEHFFECSVCGEDVRAAAKFMEEARNILGEDARADDRLKSGRPLSGSSRTAKKPGGGRTPGWLVWLKPQFAAPVMAALLVLVGLESFQIIPNLRRQVEEAGAAQVMTPTVLPGIVRGESATPVISAGGPVLLTMDLRKAPAKGTPLQFIIESADGKEARRVPGIAPEPGRTENLMIPHLDFPAGTYTVVAELASKPGTHGQELGRFPFRLETQSGADPSK
jgi:hypothetical protein